MHDGSLRALEFDRIVEAVRSLALTPLGAAALGGLGPQTDARAVRAALSATTEGVEFLASHDLPLRGPEDLEEALGALAIEGRLLEPRQLRGLATFLASIDAVRGAVRQADAASFPGLRALVEGCRPFEREVSDIQSTIDEQGEVVDRASPELRAIRDRLRRQRQRLRNTLASFLRGRDTARYPAGAGRHRARRPLRAPRALGASGLDSRHRARQLRQRRQPLPRAAEHGRDQQRHRRPRAGRGERDPAHPAGPGERAAQARARPAPHGFGGHRARRHPGSRAVLAARGRRRAGAGARLANRAAGGAPSAADPRGPGAGRSRGATRLRKTPRRRAPCPSTSRSRRRPGPSS